MITTINLPADELSSSILKSIKEAYKGRNIEIIISDTKSSAEQPDVLLARMKSLRKNKKTVNFVADDFFKAYRKKIADASN